MFAGYSRIKAQPTNGFRNRPDIMLMGRKNPDLLTLQQIRITFYIRKIPIFRSNSKQLFIKHIPYEPII